MWIMIGNMLSPMKTGQCLGKFFTVCLPSCKKISTYFSRAFSMYCCSHFVSGLRHTSLLLLSLALLGEKQKMNKYHPKKKKKYPCNYYMT